MALSKEEKKLLMKQYKETNKVELILEKEKVADLFAFIENQLEKTPCDHSLKYTEEWLKSNVSEDMRGAVIAEIERMGGYCDCEILLNCYEEYDF